MKDIGEVIWFDGGTARPFAEGDKGRAFKWILGEREGRLVLVAMPEDTSLDFHKELRDAVCETKGWRTEDLEILGGGVRLSDGRILHRSTYFGEMPESYRDGVLHELGL